MKKRQGAVFLFLAAVGVMVVSFVALGVIYLEASVFKNAEASRIASSAQFLAMTKLNELNVTAYENLKAEAKARIEGTDFFREVLLGDEESFAKRGKKRAMTVKVYYEDEKQPRYTAAVTIAVREEPVKKKMIVLYSGSLDDIPTGWALCNGQNGTPDLSGKFVVMYGNNEQKNFGFREISTIMEHIHTTGFHALTESEMPRHTHTHFDPTRVAMRWSLGSKAYFDRKHSHTSYKGGGEKHNHGDTERKEHLPPWFALAYIMKL